jgi:CRP/FNR family transcriptional regulator, cyclic AMP receptor protein
VGKQLSAVGLAMGRKTDDVKPAHLPQKMSRAWVDVLAGVPLFAGLSRRHLTKIARLGFSKRYASGSALVKSGDPGEHFFLILDGRAGVRAGARRVGLGIGDFFGEMSLLDGEPRSATVAAQTDVLVMMVSRRKFLKLLESEPRIAIAVMTTLSRRVRSMQAAGL